MTNKTGWPAPELAQDDHRGLFRWLASKLDARRLVREAVERIKSPCPPGMCARSALCKDFDCQGHPRNQ